MIPTASQFRYHPSFHHGSPELAQAYHHYHGPRAFRRSGGSRFIWVSQTSSRSRLPMVVASAFGRVARFLHSHSHSESGFSVLRVFLSI